MAAEPPRLPACMGVAVGAAPYIGRGCCASGRSPPSSRARWLRSTVTVFICGWANSREAAGGQQAAHEPKAPGGVG